MPSHRQRQSFRSAGSSKRRFFTIFTSLCTLCMLIAIGILQFTHVFTTQVSAMQPLVAVRGSHTPLLSFSHQIGPADPNQPISLSIGLQPRNQASLNSYVQDIARPTSSNYHHFLSMAQYIQTYSPTMQSYQALSQFLRAAGFTITRTYTHRLALTVRGTIGQAERAFHVHINQYTQPGGRRYYANDRDPLLPAELATYVQNIAGLNNAQQWQRAPLFNHHVAVSSATDHAGSTRCPVPSSGYLLPQQVAQAYNLQQLYAEHYQGEGQSVALFELGTFSMADLRTYSACFGGGNVPVQTIVAGNTAIPTDGSSLEVEVDAELILSAAPHLGVLKIYEAGNNAADYLASWAQIIQDGVPVVSTSWGACEQSLDPGLIQQENTIFQTAIVQGQSIFAASGDSGSAGCIFDDNTTPTILNVEDPAAQPYVTSVGGTTLRLGGGTSTYALETAWNNLPDSRTGYAGGASGGGLSQYWAAPPWQSAPGVVNGYTNGTVCHASLGFHCREVPDVSLHANPYNGYLIYCTQPLASCSSRQPWIAAGGTSAATPLWAAMMALTNEMALRRGGFNIGFANPLLYQIAKDKHQYGKNFHDVMQGNNDFNNLNHGNYPATPGFDLVTGLGSFNGYSLARALVAVSHNQLGRRSAPTSTRWYFAEGSVGGGFQEYLTMYNPSTSRDAGVDVTYLFEHQSPRTIRHIVQKSVRLTISVNEDLHIATNGRHLALATIVRVTNSVGIVVERPLYFNYKGIQSGTDSMGVTTAQTSAFFPLVRATSIVQDHTYYTYFTALNPSSSTTARITFTYLTGNCSLSHAPACSQQVLLVPPLHRATIVPSWKGAAQVAAQVHASIPVVIERPTYFRDTPMNEIGQIAGATNASGSDARSHHWYFAEGYTGAHFQEYLALANYSEHSNTARIVLEYNNGHMQTVTVTIPALSLYLFDVNRANHTPLGTCDTTPCQLSDTQAAEVVSDIALVAERLTYFRSRDNRFSGATETIGQNEGTLGTVYSFAEGYTAGDFQEYLALQNPTNKDTTIAITLFADTYVFQEQVLVKARSRQTVDINALVVPVVQGASNMGADSYAVSLAVQSLSATKIMAERVLYFNHRGAQGATAVAGYH